MHVHFGCKTTNYCCNTFRIYKGGVKSYPAVPLSSAQNLIITTGNLLHFSAWHKMILTGIQHSNLLHSSAWHKMTITGIQHVYLTSCQIPLAINNKHQLQKYRLRVSVVLQGAAIWSLLTAYALGYGNALTRAIQFAQEHN